MKIFSSISIFFEFFTMKIFIVIFSFTKSKYFNSIEKIVIMHAKNNTIQIVMSVHFLHPLFKKCIKKKTIQEELINSSCIIKLRTSTTVTLRNIVITQFFQISKFLLGKLYFMYKRIIASEKQDPRIFVMNDKRTINHQTTIKRIQNVINLNSKDAGTQIRVFPSILNKFNFSHQIFLQFKRLHKTSKK